MRGPLRVANIVAEHDIGQRSRRAKCDRHLSDFGGVEINRLLTVVASDSQTYSGRSD